MRSLERGFFNQFDCPNQYEDVGKIHSKFRKQPTTLSLARSHRPLAVLLAISLFVWQTPLDAGRAVFTGVGDAEPIKAGFSRDSVVLYPSGFKIDNGNNPYRDKGDHVFAETGYSDTWPNFFPELVSDIHPDLVEAIGGNDFTLHLTLDPKSTALKPFTTRSGQRFGIYLQFDDGQPLGGAYVFIGFDWHDSSPNQGNRPFALVGQGYWTYYIDPRDVTGTAETITLVRRGDVFQLYTSTEGSSFVAAAGQRTDMAMYPDVNGSLAIKPNIIKDLGPGRALSALTLWTESPDKSQFDASAGRIRSVVIESDALTRDINPDSLVEPRIGFFGDQPSEDETKYTIEGTVVDCKSIEPLNYAHVAFHVDGKQYVVITNSQGQYEATLGAGIYKLEITAKGYRPYIEEIDLAASGSHNYALADRGNIHYVGVDHTFQSIQKALEAANDGDTIMLDPGTYDESFKLMSNIAIRGAGHQETTFAGAAYRDVAITPFLAEYYPPYGADEGIFKAALTNVNLTGFTLDGGSEHESFKAETVSERFKMLMAIDRLDLGTVKQMLEANPELATVRYYTEDAPKHGATFLTRNMDQWVVWTPELRETNAAIAKLLIDGGADIEGPGGYAWSAGGRPLHIAANHDNVRVARLLLEAGAEVNSLVNEKTPLEWSVGQGVRVTETAGVLIDAGATHNLLHYVHFKMLDRLERTLGDQINALFPWSGVEPTSLLHVAVRNDFPDLVEWLLERGADPDLKDANGLTPKQVAVSFEKSTRTLDLLGIDAASAQ